LIVHLIDGTYELFRQFFGARRANSGVDTKFGAVRGVLNDVLRMFETGGPYVGVATDRVIESFRNQMWPGYKTGYGIDPVLWSQFRPLEDGLEAMGVTVWPMVELEADDALASAAAIADRDKSVEKVCIWTPDKDLAQCVVGDRVVQIDRRRNIIRNEAGVQEKFGVLPASIPDYLALVGDTADGYPGIDGFGAKSAAAILRKFGTIEAIPADASEWRANVTSAGRLAKTLSEQRDRALLFKDLATLRTNAPLFKSVKELRWKGPTDVFAKFATAIESPELVARAERACAKVSQ
jgi:5'-3' exonuclease